MKTKFWRLFWISDANTNRCKKQLTDVSFHVRQGRIIFCRQTLFRAGFQFKEHLSDQRTTCSPEPLSFKAKAGCQEVSVWSWLTFWTFLVLLSPNHYPCAVRNFYLVRSWRSFGKIAPGHKGSKEGGGQREGSELEGHHGSSPLVQSPHRRTNLGPPGTPTSPDQHANWNANGHGTTTPIVPGTIPLLITVVHWICTSYMAVIFESFLWSVQWLMVLLIPKGKFQEFVFLLTS